MSDVERGLACLERQFLDTADRRGVFVSAYVMTTESLTRCVRDARFERDDLVHDYIVAFANLYLRALRSAGGSSPQPVADAWQVSFSASRSGSLRVIQDLVLGINAHLNHDLPLAIFTAGVNTECRACVADHERINEILRSAVPRIRRRIVRLYQPALRIPNVLWGRALDGLTGRVFVQARLRAFEWGAALRRAPSGDSRSRILRTIDHHATELARRMLDARRTPAHYIRCLSEAPPAGRAPDAATV